MERVTIQDLTGILKVMKPGRKIALRGFIPDGPGINWNTVITRGLFMKGFTAG